MTDKSDYPIPVREFVDFALEASDYERELKQKRLAGFYGVLMVILVLTLPIWLWAWPFVATVAFCAWVAYNMKTSQD